MINETKKALVVGLGISGISSAIALNKAGWQVTIVEKAPSRRKGGYFIGLFGLGREAAKHLGSLGGLHDRRGPSSENFSINREGITGNTFGFADAPKDFGPWMMLRGDVEEATFNALPKDIEIFYNTQPVDIWQNASGARVTLKNNVKQSQITEMYDLVVGADGIHSQVREMTFGPAKKYIKELGYMICAFELPSNPPDLKADQGVILTEIGKSFWVFPFKDHPATVLFTYKVNDPQAERKLDPKIRIREVFGEPYGKYMSFALDQLDQADEFIFDTTQQVKMPSWHQGHVVLVGDSAWCPTLYSGMGATTGIGGADLLGQTLQKHPDDLEAALTEWEKILRPKVKQFQKQGAGMGRKNFVVNNQKELDKRNKNVEKQQKLLKNPIFAKVIKNMPLIKMRNDDLTKHL